MNPITLQTFMKKTSLHYLSFSDLSGDRCVPNKLWWSAEVSCRLDNLERLESSDCNGTRIVYPVDAGRIWGSAQIHGGGVCSTTFCRRRILTRQLDAVFCHVSSGGAWRWKSDSWISGVRLVALQILQSRNKTWYSPWSYPASTGALLVAFVSNFLVYSMTLSHSLFISLEIGQRISIFG